jgi:methenyltetrahydromethanopterin cyclohydrolase
LTMWSLNRGGLKALAPLLADPERFGCRSHVIAGARVIDCGVESPGSWEAGRLFTLGGLGGLAEVSFGLTAFDGWFLPTIATQVDQPALSAVLSHAGAWPLGDGPLAPIGSGPIRAMARADPWSRLVEYADTHSGALLLLQSTQLPDESLIHRAATAAGIASHQLVALVARTASLVGAIQVAGRTVEQVLVKMAYHGFDVRQVVWARGVAPIPPPVQDEEVAMGRVNDSLLYGAENQVWVEAHDTELLELVPKLVFCNHAGSLYGKPFADIFRSFGSNWFNVPPEIDSPAKVTVYNVASGRAFNAGRIDYPVLIRSFGV